MLRHQAEATANGKTLVERLAIYPVYARDLERWVEPALVKPTLDHLDAAGFARGPDRWSTGKAGEHVSGLPSAERPRGAGNGNG